MDNKNIPKEKFSYKSSAKNYKKPKLDKILIFNRIFYRPAASLIVRILFRTSVTPNQLTVFSFLLGILSAIFFVQGEYLYFITGAIVLQFSQLLDVADGMLARSKNMGSEYGAFLDLFLDRVTDFLLISSISAGVYFQTGNLKLLLTGLLTLGLYFLQVTLFYITNLYIKNHKAGETEEGRAFLIFLFLVFALFNRLDILIYLLFLETVINILSRIGHLFWLRRRSL